jgi:hypothetical protein
VATPPQPSLLPPRPQKPKLDYTPILITIACAFGVGISSCFGFGTTVGSYPGLATALGVIFVASALVFVISIFWLMIRLLINTLRE